MFLLDFHMYICGVKCFSLGPQLSTCESKMRKMVHVFIFQIPVKNSFFFLILPRKNFRLGTALVLEVLSQYAMAGSCKP